MGAAPLASTRKASEAHEALTVSRKRECRNIKRNAMVAGGLVGRRKKRKEARESRAFLVEEAVEE